MNERKPGKPGSTMETGIVQRGGRARLGREAQQKIGQQLRAMYDDVVKEGVPDRFADMLRQLKEKDPK